MYISWEVSFSLTWSHPHSNSDDTQAYDTLKENDHFPLVLSCRGQAALLSVTGACEFFRYSSTSAMTAPLARSTPGITCVSSCLTSFGYQLKSELLRNVFLDSSICYNYQHAFWQFVGFPDGSEHCLYFFPFKYLSPSLSIYLCRREWQSTPLVFPGESHGQRSLAVHSWWGHKESDMTEWLTLNYFTINTLLI